MADEEMPAEQASGARRPRLSMWRWRISLGLLVLLLSVVAVAWFARERIAGNIIEEQLDALGIDATYDIERVGGTRQVVSNLVVGNPQHPDFTAEQVSVILRYRFGAPVIGRIELVKPRLFGTLRDGQLSFGTLDPLIFTDSGEPPSLPDLDVKITDGRGLIASDMGPIGIKLEGEGEIDSGFAGIVAVAAPALSTGGCAISDGSAYGRLTTRAGKPSFDGPVRLDRLECPERSIAVRRLALMADVTGDKDLSGIEGKARIATRSLVTPWLAANGANGTMSGKFRGGNLRSRYTLALRGVDAEQARIAVLTADGTLRASDGFGQVELETSLEGNGLRIGDGLGASLADLETSTSDTLLAPLLRKARLAFERESRGSSFAGRVSVRSSDKGFSFVMPEGRIVGGSGATLLSLSRVQFGAAEEGGRFLGNFATGGDGVPRIVGRMERRGQGAPVLRMRMAEYTAGSSSLAIPELVVAQSPQGVIGFAGRMEASGALPGGSTRGLRVPVSGNYSASGGLSLWRACTDVRFDRLEVANLALGGTSLTLCPSSSGAIVRTGPRGLRIAAGSPSLNLSGMLGETPIRIASGPVGFAWPGAMSARALDVTLGPAGTDTRFRIANLDAQLGKDIQGTFDDADVRLYAVPLDLNGASGNWAYRGGALSIGDATFNLVDREEPARFEPLVARDARLVLENNVIDAFAELREPTTDRIVTAVDIRHSLATGTGHADLDVAGLRFDDSLQPDMLSQRALGVIANAEGIVTGTGRIDWNEAGVTSSGEFSTDGFDFAAAFGPVKGASGTIVFTDLLGLTTAPGQTLKVASINPGIEIFDGEVAFDLNGGTALTIAGGTWPFLGGTLQIEPVKITFGASEVRKYILVITGLEAAQFVERMELGNISATGTFDGTVPLIFDEAGNGRIEGGVLTARPPGGNVSYVGELTYEDLSPIANFAFDTLRSLDFTDMVVRMDGSLTGEIVTRVRFDGVTQGEGARSNIITKQIARLPIRFNVNIRAPFYQLITSLKAMYDPAFVRDPRELGLLSDDGTRLKRSVTGADAAPDVGPADIIPDEPPIQTPESETMP